MTTSRDAVFKGITATIIIVLILSQLSPTTLAQTTTTITPADRFNIPSQNGIVSFAVNGTYANATLQDDVWTFTDLKLTGSQPLEKLEVSTRNSDIIIFSHLSYDTLRKIALLTYFAEGQGTQTLNIGIEAGESQGGVNVEWSVIVNDVFVAEGDRWSITPEGTLTITGATGNVTVIYFSIEDGNNTDLPFVQQHSIVIITAVATITTVFVAIIIRARSKSVRIKVSGDNWLRLIKKSLKYEEKKEAHV